MEIHNGPKGVLRRVEKEDECPLPWPFPGKGAWYDNIVSMNFGDGLEDSKNKDQFVLVMVLMNSIQSGV